MTSIAEKEPARKIHVPRIYPGPSRCFFASGRHRVWQEGIRDATGLLQAQSAQPLCTGEGSNPRICAAPSLIPGVAGQVRDLTPHAEVAVPWYYVPSEET